MIITLVTTVDLVLLPRMSYLIASKKVEKVVKILKLSIDIQLYFTIPIMFGLVLITPKFIPWFFGAKFEVLKLTIPAISPLIVIIPFGMALGRQFLLPMNRMKTYNSAVIVGAIISIIVNLTFIPFIGVWGAIVATLLSELSVSIIRFIDFRKQTNFQFNYIYLIKLLFTSIIMCIVTAHLTSNLSSTFLTTVIQVAIGGVVYILITTVLKSNPLLELYRKKSYWQD